MAGFVASKTHPSFYYCLNEEKKTVAVLTTHVDDLLFSSLPEGDHVVKKLLVVLKSDAPKRELSGIIVESSSRKEKMEQLLSE